MLISDHAVTYFYLFPRLPAPPCELRVAVEQIALISQRVFQKSAVEAATQDSEVAATTAMHGRIWQDLLAATSVILARTDQQGYGVVVVQWLMGSTCSSPRDDHGYAADYGRDDEHDNEAAEF